jgi:ABC-type transport system substrate-binding protein
VRRAKVIMLAYLGAIACLVVVAMVGLALAPPVQRDPQTYYEAYWNTAQTFDSAKAYDTVSNKMVEQCVESLYEYDGFKPGYPLIPALAASMPEVSEDGRVYTIRLRPNVRYPSRWADGTPVEPWRDEPRHVRAEDFVFAFKRIADFHNASNHYGQILQGRIVGAETFRKATEQRDPETWYYDEVELPGVRAIDPLTLQIELQEPFPQLIYKLNHAATGPMPKEYYKHYTVDATGRHNRRVMKWRLLGTGPYQLVDYQRERHVLFTTNPLYRGRPDVDGHPIGLGGPHPSLAPDEIMPYSVRHQAYLFTRESLPRWYNFTLGGYDKIWFIPMDKFGEAIEGGEVSARYAGRGMRQVTVPRPTIEYCGFHMKDDVFRHNLPLRQAMNLAIDREEYVRKFLNGDAILPAGLVTPGSFTWDPDRQAVLFTYDPDRARLLVEEAKRLHRERYGEELPTITYTLRGNRASSLARGEFLRLCWKAVGLDVEIEALDFAKWLDEVYAHNLQSYSSGWVADYPDEETYLGLFYGPSYDGGSNATGYQNAEYDRLYEQARVMQDSPERRDLYRRMARMIEEDVPIALLYYHVRREMYFDWLGDLQIHVYLKAQPMYYRLDGALREARLSGRVEGTLQELHATGRWPEPDGS